ncbi:hypothetical protein ABE60_18270 [Lysinibacillus sphaericus]|nr:hypothetical protein [Lysinibacillus sphaericus]MBG9479436.1 hypothetical protein [Lysinibacillus sphaericus]
MRTAIGARIYQLTTIKGAQGPLYKALYSALKERYHVDSYSSIHPKDLQDAIRFVESWKG